MITKKKQFTNELKDEQTRVLDTCATISGCTEPPKVSTGTSPLYNIFANVYPYDDEQYLMLDIARDGGYRHDMDFTEVSNIEDDSRLLITHDERPRICTGYYSSRDFYLSCITDKPVSTDALSRVVTANTMQLVNSMDSRGLHNRLDDRYDYYVDDDIFGISTPIFAYRVARDNPEVTDHELQCIMSVPGRVGVLYLIADVFDKPLPEIPDKTDIWNFQLAPIVAYDIYDCAIMHDYTIARDSIEDVNSGMFVSGIAETMEIQTYNAFVSDIREGRRK